MKKLRSLEDLLLKEINEIYDAEHRLLEFLGNTIPIVHSIDLQEVLTKYKDLTQDQLTRLELVFNLSYTAPMKEKSQIMIGLIREGKELRRQAGSPEMRDAAILAILRQIAHYQMAAFGIISSYAKLLEQNEYDYLMKECLDIEKRFEDELINAVQHKIDYDAATIK